MSAQGLRLTRRTLFGRCASLGGCALAGSASVAQAVEEREAVFSGGDVKFLQPWFDEIRYKGVIRVEVGRVDDDVHRIDRLLMLLDGVLAAKGEQ